MNIIEIQDSLKDLPDSALMKEMQAPTGTAPQFLVLSELKRRKRMRDDYQRQQNADMKTVAEEVVTGAGMPQEGIMQVSKAMNPNSSIAQNTGMGMAAPVQPTQAPQMMADGGLVKMRTGGAISAQPTGQDGTYILVQDGERVSGTGIYPDFKSANEAAKAIRDVPVFQRSRVLSGLDSPQVSGVDAQTQMTSLSQVDPDLMAYAADDPIRRSLQQRQAAGTREDPSVGGIASLDPLGRAFMDEYRPDMSVMKGIPSGGEGADVMSYMPLSPMQSNIESQGFLPNVDPRFASEDQRAEQDAQMELSRLAGAVPLADAVSEMSGNKPVDFDASAPAPLSEVDLMRRDARTTGMVRPDVDFADPTMVPDPNFRVDQITQEKVDLTPELLDSLPGVISGKTPNEKASEIGDFLRSIPVADEFTGTGSSSEGVDVGIPMPSPDQPTIDVTVDDATTPSEQAEQVAAALSLPVTTSGIEEFVEQEKLRGFGMPTVDGDGGGDGGGDKPTPPTTPRGGAGFGSIESRIARMLEDREKSAEADKWLALAQTGMALMASKNPTIGGALGEAGLAGLGAMKKSRQQYDDDMLKLLGAQQKIQSAKDLAAYRQASLNKKSIPKTASLSEINAALDYYTKIAEDQSAIKDDFGEIIGNDPSKIRPDVASILSELNDLYTSRIKTGVIDADVTS